MSLSVAFWINGTLLNVAGVVALALLTAKLYAAGLSPFASATAIKILAFTGAVVWIWEVVGIWRSASKHKERGGSGFWAGAAVVVTALRSFRVVIVLVGLAIMGPDDVASTRPVTVRAAADGRSVTVAGYIGPGSGTRVVHVLDSVPGATAVVLASIGGLVDEGIQIAGAVRSRHLNTYVERLCASACTEVLIAGVDRAVAPGARIGFHRAKYMGGNADSDSAAIASMVRRYRAAGLPDDFVRHVVATPAETLWYPDTSALLAARVITRVSLGGEYPSYSMANGTRAEFREEFTDVPLWLAYDRRFAGAIDRITDSAWRVKQRGGSDAEILAVVDQFREVMDGKLFRSLDDTMLDQFYRIVYLQLLAARAIGPDACVSQANGALSESDVLPQAIRDSAIRFKIRALNREARPERVPPLAADTKRAFREAVHRMPRDLVPVLANPTDFEARPALRCAAVVAFRASIEALPADERHLVLRSMFQADR